MPKWYQWLFLGKFCLGTTWSIIISNLWSSFTAVSEPVSPCSYGRRASYGQHWQCLDEFYSVSGPIQRALHNSVMSHASRIRGYSYVYYHACLIHSETEAQKSYTTHPRSCWLVGSRALNLIVTLIVIWGSALHQALFCQKRSLKDLFQVCFLHEITEAQIA